MTRLIKYSLLALFLSLFASSAFAQTCGKVMYESPTNTANRITFMFDKKYPCGQYANGDWWVSPKTLNTAVKITAIYPRSTSTRNGYIVNPTAKDKHAFDARVSSFDATLKPGLPLVISQASSVIKTISVPEVAGKKCRPCLSYAAVLTVIKEPLANSNQYFRPGYFGTNKTLFKTDIPKWKAILATYQLAPDSTTTAAMPTISDMAKRYKAVQLEGVEDFNADYLHPTNNVPNYGAEIARDNAAYALRVLMSDFNLDQKTHAQAFINYMQMAVDYYSLASNGFTWPENGGHGNGRKLPLMLGRLFIDDTLFADAVYNSAFSEDQQIYTSRLTGQALYGVECGEDAYWDTVIFKKGDRTCRDPYEQIDGGGAEIGGAYQLCCTAKPWKYTALVLYLFDLKEAWAYSSFFDYVQRWVSAGVLALPDTCAPYNGVSTDYGKAGKYGTDYNGGCIAGAGRFPSMNGTSIDGGGYNSVFADALWEWAKINTSKLN